jgi:Leucine-rich repeat (LRR) protein
MAAMLVLDAPGNAISDIAGIGALPNLVALRLEHNCLASVSEVVR